MGGTFVITLREGFEAALVLGLVYTYLEKIGARAHFGYVTWGAVLGALASLALGIVVTIASGPLVDLGPDLISAVVLFTAAGLLTWHGWWMREHARAVRGELERRIDIAQTTGQFWVLGIIAFTGVFREGAEMVLFLWGLLTQMATSVGHGLLTAAGLAGLLAAASLGVLVFHGGRRLPLGRFFSVTSVLLLLLAAGLFSTGVSRLQSLGFVPMTAALWDTSGWLDDRSLLGSFLSGLLGYRARPTGIEVVAYLAYVLFAMWLLFGRRSASASSGTEALV